ncbi:hypothetical protein [Streptomyces sp. NPDC023327]|uniref:hypothetical protein n=1 Tax=Streptomyces sp. NPDC023327 TaxID=3157088 RepID=UPI0033CF82E8
MAFSAEELRVLRRALALALHPSPHRSPAHDEDVQDCLRLAESVDEAVREGARLRAFLMADLARYRASLPGTASGYLALLEDVLGAGYQPGPDDLAALRALRGNALAATLLDRCRVLAERALRARLAGRSVPAPTRTPLPAATATATATVPASRTHLLALPGGRTSADQERPRPVPTPAEVFPPKRRPAPSPAPTAPGPPPPPAPPAPAGPPHQLAAG